MYILKKSTNDYIMKLFLEQLNINLNSRWRNMDELEDYPL